MEKVTVSSKGQWKKLQGAASGHDLMRLFAAHRKQERTREDSRPPCSPKPKPAKRGCG